jgi:fumarylacetoacetase
VNQTHDPGLTSWVESAQGHPNFPIQNLPLGVFLRGSGDRARIGIAIGDQILDLAASAATAGITEGNLAAACAASSLNQMMGLGPSHWSELRSKISGLLAANSRSYYSGLKERVLVPANEAELLLPAQVGDYTDFYASVHHATNVGSMFRPDNPLLPNYKWVPIGYHGRASSLVPSGTPIKRPRGQIKPPEAAEPVYAASRALDYEAEVGCFVGPGNTLGQPIPLEQAEEHLFGLCLVNDWSARDIQTWEYQPLGPFLAKSFATTISPWVVTLEALEPFRSAVFERLPEDPAPLPYLTGEQNRSRGGFDVSVEVLLTSAAMRKEGLAAARVSRSRMADLYWTPAQMLAHHSSNGCNLRPGDLFASGTISGPTPDSRGSLLERTWRGSEPFELPNGETRKFLEDGDEVILRAFCESEGSIRIGFGECSGTLLPA